MNDINDKFTQRGAGVEEKIIRVKGDNIDKDVLGINCVNKKILRLQIQ